MIPIILQLTNIANLPVISFNGSTNPRIIDAEIEFELSALFNIKNQCIDSKTNNRTFFFRNSHIVMNLDDINDLHKWKFGSLKQIKKFIFCVYFPLTRLYNANQAARVQTRSDKRCIKRQDITFSISSADISANSNI